MIDMKPDKDSPLPLVLFLSKEKCC